MKKVILAVLVSCLLPAFAQAEVKEVKTGNAVAWLAEEHGVPTFTIKLAFKASGSAFDPQGKEGLAEMMTNTLLEGAGDMDALAFHKTLDAKAVRISVTAGSDMVYISLQALSDYRDEAVRLFTLMLAKPRFDADAVARAKKEMVALIRQHQEDPGGIADDNWRALAWPNHAYGRTEIGTEASVEAITPQDIANFYHAHIAQDSLLIAAAGDITPAQLKPAMDGLQSALPKAAANDTKIPDIAVAPGVQKSIERDIPQTVVMFGFQGIRREDPRYYAAYMLNHILGGGELDTRLMVNLRGKHGLVYYASTDFEDRAHAVTWRGTFAAEGANVPQAMDILRQSLKEAAEKGITQAEMNDAKQFITGSFPLHISTNGALAGFLINMQYYHLGIDYLDKRNGYIRAVTLKQVNDAARDLIKGDPVVVMVGKTPQ